MRLRGMICLAILSSALLLTSACMSQASVTGILHEDLAYWYIAGDTQGQQLIQTMFNPDSAWLQENLSKVVIVVQQTVYDKPTTAEILRENGENIWDGYLFAYTVTNHNWTAAVATGGIKAFGVDWGNATPLLVTTDHSQTSAFWIPQVADTGSGAPLDGPAWLWTPATANIPGIQLGSSVGGFWALSSTGQERIVPAAAATGNVGGQVFPIIWGQTTGPVPEPASLLTLLLGTGGLAIRRLRRR